MADDRFTATTATPEEQAAIEKFMAVMARLEGKTVKDLYAPGSSVRVTKVEGSWIVRSIVEPDYGDVAILLMDLHTALPEDFTLLVFELGARLPRLGERATVLGIRSNLPGGVNEMDDDRRDLGKLAASTIASSGPVTDLYPKGRPMLGPAFSIEVTAIGCMSGGPVFDARGLTVGMISTSVKVDDTYVSTASLLWQSLWMEIGPAWPPGFLTERFRLRDVMYPPEAAHVQRESSGNGLVYIDRPEPAP